MPSLLNLGSAWITRADWEAGHGIDPSASVERALDPLERAVRINPNFLQLHNNLGNAHNTLSIALIRKGEDPTAHLDAALASYRRALEIDPRYAVGVYNVAYTTRLRATYQLRNGIDSTAAEQVAETAIRQAIRLNGSDPDNFIELAELDLLRAQRAVTVGSDPTSTVDAADASIRQARELNSDDPRLFYLEALGRRYLAEWSLVQGSPAAVLLNRGLQLADQAVTLNPQLNESIALQGVLLKLQSRLLAPPGRQRTAQRAKETLEAALEANPSLRLEYQDDLDEIDSLLAGA